MKSADESSWCNEVKRILKQYDLQSAYELYTKYTFKREMESFAKFKNEQLLGTVWEQEIYSKKSLSLLICSWTHRGST